MLLKRTVKRIISSRGHDRRNHSILKVVVETTTSFSTPRPLSYGARRNTEGLLVLVCIWTSSVMVADLDKFLNPTFILLSGDREILGTI